MGNVKKRKYALLHIEACQIKSKEKLKIVCQCLDTLEKEIGIREVEISIKDVFVCPDIDLTEFANSSVPMEKLLGGLLIKLNKMQFGKESPYYKVKK